MGDHDRVDWTVSDAPAPDEALSAAPGPAAVGPRRMLPSRRLSRRAWLLLAAFVILAVGVAAAFPRWEAWRARQAVEIVITQQEQARLAGDWTTLRATYSDADSMWADADVARLRGDSLDLPFGLPGARLDRQPGRSSAFQWLAPELARADVIRTYVLADGVHAQFAQPQYYEFSSGSWREVQVPNADRGTELGLHGSRVDAVFYPASSDLAASLVHDLDAFVARACMDWDCPGNYRVTLRLDGALSAGPVEAGPAGSLFGSVTYQTLLYSENSLPWLVVSLPIAQVGAYPADEAARTAVLRSASAQALIVIAHRLSVTTSSVNRPFLYALVVRELARLGVEKPGLSEVRVASPVFDPADLWLLRDDDANKDKAMPEALVVLNALLAGRSLADERQLLRHIGLAADAVSWLAAGLGITPAEAEARLTAAVFPPFPTGLSLAFTPDLALSCPTGPVLATLAGQTAPLLAGDFPDSLLGTWSPDGEQLAVAVSGHWGAATLANRALDQPAGQWLPPQPVEGAAPAWATDTVVVFPAGETYPASTPPSPIGPQLTFFDTAHLEDAARPLLGFAQYVPAPTHQWAAITGIQFAGTDMTVIPALGGEHQSPGVGGYGPTWSPDGQRLAFVNSDRGYFWLYLYDVSKNTNSTLLTTGDAGVPILPASANVTSVYPAWSPDGAHLAVAVAWAHKDQSGGWVGLIRPDGSGFQVLVPATSDALPTAVAFSVDGRYLAVGLGSSDRPQEVAIYSAADGSRLRVVPDAALAGWSPSGHILAVANAEGVSLLYEPGNPGAAPKAFGPPGCTGVSWKPK